MMSRIASPCGHSSVTGPSRLETFGKFREKYRRRQVSQFRRSAARVGEIGRSSAGLSSNDWVVTAREELAAERVFVLAPGGCVCGALKKLRDQCLCRGILLFTPGRPCAIFESQFIARPRGTLCCGGFHSVSLAMQHVHAQGMEAAVSIGQQQKQHLDVQIRWLIRRDMPEVLKIERESFEFPWTDEDFMCCLRQRNCIGMVAEYDHQIVGFMVYELHKSRLHILNFSVGSEYRRMGVGTQMVLRLVDKLSQQRRQEIVLEVRERNLDAQLFFKSHGFKAITVLRHHYEDTEEDAYIMRFRLDANADILSPFAPVNRISEFDAA
jgi:[ribosomal protein S18]-alanine N-acetyltransferase